TLYHDDISISQGLFDPPTTFAALAAIAGLIGLAFWQRTRRPLFALGIFWFFGGHVLTATVIPLMLAFEHRNYFPSVGLLLAVASLLVLEGPRLRARIVALGVTSLFAFYAFTTALRALEWSTPLTLAATDAAKRPDSSAAQYEYALVLLRSTKDGDPEPMRRKAFAILEEMSARPNTDAVLSQLLIVASADRGLPIKDGWWETLISKLGERPVSSVDVSALGGLMACFENGVCSVDVAHLDRAFKAATRHPGGYAQLFSLYGQFAFNYLKDSDLAEEQTRLAIRQAPSDIETRANLVKLLVARGKKGEANSALNELRAFNHFGLLDSKVAELRSAIEALESK
ncbi:hypothetical protein SAMN05216289_107134, partial [Dokdonella immobilis]